MAPNKTDEPWCFHVFDKWDAEGSYEDRWRHASAQVEVARCGLQDMHIRTLQYETFVSQDGLDKAEEYLVSEGFEGAILRRPGFEYKFGRGSGVKCDLVKLKRFEDGEATVIGVEEELHNGNEAVTNALGRTERSTVRANKTGKGTLGALIVRDLVSGVEFKVGTGFDAADRAYFWDNSPIGQVAKYKHFPVGAKDKPRHPVFLGFRDMSLDG